jgi:hypothetical protein
MVARRSTLWCGFLEAGEKGGPVVRDSSLDTGNPATVYLFNLIRNRILEYRRDIVEPKLRELRPDELAMVKSLRAAFEAARGDFTPRNGFRPTSLPRRRAKKDQAKTESANLDFDPDGPMPLDDDPPLLLEESEA